MFVTDIAAHQHPSAPDTCRMLPKSYNLFLLSIIRLFSYQQQQLQVNELGVDPLR
jgi:hypothetical protein